MKTWHIALLAITSVLFAGNMIFVEENTRTRGRFLCEGDGGDWLPIDFWGSGSCTYYRRPKAISPPAEPYEIVIAGQRLLCPKESGNCINIEWACKYFEEHGAPMCNRKDAERESKLDVKP